MDESQPAHIRCVFEKLVALHFEPYFCAGIRRLFLRAAEDVARAHHGAQIGFVHLAESELIVRLGSKLGVKAVESKIARVHSPGEDVELPVAKIHAEISGFDFVPNRRKDLQAAKIFALRIC